MLNSSSTILTFCLTFFTITIMFVYVFEFSCPVTFSGVFIRAVHQYLLNFMINGYVRICHKFFTATYGTSGKYFFACYEFINVGFTINMPTTFTLVCLTTWEVTNFTQQSIINRRLYKIVIISTTPMVKAF